MRIIILLSLFGLSFGLNEVCPSFRESDADVCGSTLFMVNHNFQGFPTTLNNMNTHCVNLHDAYSCVNNYSSQCLNGQPQNVINLLLAGINGEINRECLDTTAMNGEYDVTWQSSWPHIFSEFLSHVNCFNHNYTGLHTCMHNYIGGLWSLQNFTGQNIYPPTCW